jgi:hypothetical protein
MATIAEVLRNNSDKKSLINAVLNQLGIDKNDELKESYLYDIYRNGIDGGYTGFTYYSDTTEFYRKNRSNINTWVLEMANDFGEDPISMVCNFGCVKDQSVETKTLVGKCIYSGRLNEETKYIENALAWFAGEEVARLFFDNE